MFVICKDNVRLAEQLIAGTYEWSHVDRAEISMQFSFMERIFTTPEKKIAL